MSTQKRPSTDNRKQERQGFLGGLLAFMEERNIFWGELVGGLLVIGCSLALVISLRQLLEGNPFYKLLTFTTAAAGMLGAGLYTHRRWKLETTSRGLLLLGLLLVPVQLLPLTAPGQTTRTALVDLGLPLLSLLALAWPVYRAAEILAGSCARLLTVGLLLLAGCQAPVAWVLGAAGSSPPVLGLAPVLCQVLVVAPFLARLSREAFLDSRQVPSLFVLVGVTCFAVVVVLALEVLLQEDPGAGLLALAVPVAAGGLLLTASGALVHQGLAEDLGEDTDLPPVRAGYRTGGTVVTLTGLLLVAGGLALGWPRPLPVLAVTLLTALVLPPLAVRFRLPPLHGPAILGLTVASLVLLGLAQGWPAAAPGQGHEALAGVLLGPHTTILLLAPLALCLGACEVLGRARLAAHEQAYAIGVMALGGVAFLLASWHGPAQPGQPLVVYPALAAGLLLLRRRRESELLLLVSLLLVVGASLWGLWALEERARGMWGLVLALESVTLVAGHRLRAGEGRAFLWASSVAGSLALLATAFTLAETWYWNMPPSLAPVAALALLAGEATLRGLLTGRRGPLHLGGGLVVAALLGAATWAGLLTLALPVPLLLGLALAPASTLLAATALLVSGRQGRPALVLLGSCWRDVALAAGGLALVLVLPAWADALLLGTADRSYLIPTAFLTVTAFLAAWRGPEWATHAGIALALLGLLQLQSPQGLPALPDALLLSLLLHATACAAGHGLPGWKVPGEVSREQMLRQPLAQWSLASALLALVPLAGRPAGSPGELALWVLWLAGLWLVQAWQLRDRLLFVAFQAALLLAVVLGTVAWTATWAVPPALPEALKAQGIALGALALVWRLARGRLEGHPRLETLFPPSWPKLDHVLVAALLLGVVPLALLNTVPAVLEEVSPQALALLPVTSTGDAGGWLSLGLLGLLAVFLAADSWRGLSAPQLLGWLTLALTGVVLAAGGFAAERAAGSALRWLLALGFLACSVPVWWADRLPDDRPRMLARLARWFLLLAMAVPGVVLLVLVVVLDLVGRAGPGPLPGSILARMGPLANGLVPAALVWLGLVVHALRARLPGYLLGAGVLGNLVASLALCFSLRGQPLERWLMPLLQLNGVAFALTALLWLVCRRRLLDATGAMLLGVQLVLAGAACTAALGVGLALLLLHPKGPPHPASEVSAVPGWLALLLTGAAWCWQARLRGGSLRPPLVFLGLGTGILLGCLASGPGGTAWAGYHLLEGSWAVVALGLLAAGWSVEAAPGEEAERAGVVGSWWAAGVATLTALLALRAGLADPWWSAGTLLGVAGVYAALALWRREEAWMLAASVGAQLAAAIVFARGSSLSSVFSAWVGLLQVTLLAASAVTLGWLAAARRLYSGQPRSATTAPVLALQALLLVVGSLAILVGPLLALLLDPGHPSSLVLQAGGPASWAALLAVLLAVGLYAGRAPAGGGLGVLRLLGLGLGVLIACAAARYDAGSWLAYHALFVSWAALGGLILAAGWRREGREAESTSALGWVLVLAAALLGLIVRGLAEDPGRPWWPAGELVGLGTLLALLALWRREESWALGATAAVNAAVLLFVGTSGDLQTWDTRAWAVTVTTLLAVGVWRAGVKRLHGTSHPTPWQAPLLTLTLAAAALAGLALLGRGAFWLIYRPDALASHVARTGSPLGWLVLLLAGGLVLWHFRPRGSVPGLTAGLLVLGLQAACTLAPWDGGRWIAYRALAGLWLAAALLVLASRRGGGWRRRLLVEGCGGGIDLLVVLLAIRGFLGEPGLLAWWIGLVLAVAVQAGVLAWRQGSEVWAGITTLAVDLAVSLWLWDAPSLNPGAPWWMWLVQANMISTTLAGLLWLAARKRFYGEEHPSVTGSPLLGLHVLAGLAGNVVLLLNPGMLALVQHPGTLPPSVAAANGVWGWLTLGLSSITAIAYLLVTRLEGAAHVLGSIGVGVGVMAASTAARHDRGDWLAYHVLMAAWTLVGAAMLAGGWAEARRRLVLLKAGGDMDRPLFSERVAQTWLTMTGLPVLALALRGVLEDPAGAWWSSGVIVALSVLATLLSIWQRRPGWTCVAGLGVNLAVSLALWRTHQGEPLRDWVLPLVVLNVLAGAAVSLLWLGAISRLEPELPYRKRSLMLLRFQVGAGWAVLLALLTAAASAIVVVPRSWPPLLAQGSGPLSWGAFVLLALAAASLARLEGWPTRPAALGVAGLGLGVLAAVGAGTTADSVWVAYHALLPAWAAMGLLLLAAQAPTLSVAVCALLTLAVGLRGGLVDPSGAWWPVAGVLASAAMAGGLALQRRGEAWALASTVSVLLAVVLVTVRLHEGEPLADWWVVLVQAGTLSLAGMALVWLTCWRLLSSGERPSTLLLTVQVLLPLLGNGALLAGPAVHLIGRPEVVHPAVAQAGSVWGWLTLLAAGVPAVMHARRTRATAGGHLLAGITVGALLLAACSVARLTGDGVLAFRLLVPAWGGLAFLFLGVVWARGGPAAGALPTWMLLLGVLVLLLAGRSLVGPAASPLVAGAAIAEVALLAAGAALWRRRESWMLIGNVLAVLAGAVLLSPVPAGSAGGLLKLPLQLLTVHALWGLAWLAISGHLYQGERPTTDRAPLLGVAMLPGLAIVGGLLAQAAHLLLLEPLTDSLRVRAVGGNWGWLAVTTTLATLLWYARRALPWVPAVLLAPGLILGGVMAACTLASRQPGSALPYLALLGVWAVTGPVLLLCGRPVHPEKQEEETEFVFGEIEVVLPVLLTLVAATRGLFEAGVGLPWCAGAILLESVALAGLAVRARQDVWALLACLTTGVGTSLLAWDLAGRPVLEGWWVVLVRLNVIVAALCGLLWARAPLSVLRRLHLGLMVAGCLILVVGPAFWLIARPAPLAAGVVQAGHPGTWLAILLAVGVVVAQEGWTLLRGGVAFLTPVALALGVLVACSVAVWDRGDWLAYHVLLLGWLITSALPLTITWPARLRGAEAEHAGIVEATVVVAVLALVLGVRALEGDPGGPWWSVGTFLTVGVLALVLARATRHADFVAAGMVLLVLAALAAAPALGFNGPKGLQGVGLLALAAAAIPGTLVERSLRQRRLPLGQLAALLALAGAAALLVGRVRLRLEGAMLEPYRLGGLTWLVLTAALLVTLWDPRARLTLAGLYGGALLGLALAWDGLGGEGHWLLPALALLVSGTAGCRASPGRWAHLGAAVGIPDRAAGWWGSWVAPAQLAVSLTVLAGSLGLVLTGATLPARLVGPASLALLIPGLLLGARHGEEDTRAVARWLALLTAGLGLVEVGWAVLEPGREMILLERLCLLLAGTALLAVVYGMVLPRRLGVPAPEWARAGRQVGVLAGVLGVLALGLVLLLELVLRGLGQPALPVPIVAVAAAGIALLVGALLASALWPELDPLRLPAWWREAHVYAAELLVAALYLHLRLSLAGLMTGRLRAYWTLILLTLAFLIAALGEVFRRLRLEVLAGPLVRTGMVLVFVPVLAYPARPAGDYATLWLLVSLVYALLAMARGSMPLGLVSALAGNVGLWSLLHREGLGFLHHPQLWLGPFGLTVLVGAQLNRDRLTRGQLASFRYLGLTLLYLASAAETFLTGLGENVSRPLVLVVLAVAGTFAGILLRVRAFLFLGLAFLCLGIFALVWYAAAHQAWIWYVAGIALGMGIIALFALLEKRRADILRLLERLREWE